MEHLLRNRWKCRRIRHLVVALLFFSTVCMSAMRVNLSVTIGAMVSSSPNSSTTELSANTACSNGTTSPSISESKKVMSEGEFHWEERIQSIVIGSFYYGYIFGELLATLLVQRFGVRWFAGLSMFICTLLAFLTPVSAYWGAEFLIGLRLVQGVLQGVIVPTMNMIVSEWVPIMERSRSFTFVASGISFGSLLGMFLSGVLVDSSGGWPSAFYVPGAIGCLWYVLWLAFVYDSPSRHPFITEEELNFIKSHQDSKEDKISHHVPWKSILMSAPVWAYCLATAGQLLGLYVIMIEMPIYLFSVLKFDVKASGILSSIPFMLRIIFSYVSSIAADAMRKSGKLSINFIRKLMNSIGLYSAGLCLLAVASVGCQGNVIVGLLCACCGLSAFCFNGCMVTAVDMSPRYSATLGGMAFTLGNCGGALLPLLVSEITKSGQTVENWSWVFIIAAAIYFLTGTLFIWLGSARLQPWDSTSQQEQYIPCSSSTVEQNAQF